MGDAVNGKEYDLLFLNDVTPLHNGSGEGIGIVDNSIIRERITNFPIILGSSLKGVIRDTFKNSEDVNALFGPEIGRGQEHAGALSFTDGMILAFPVRSFRGCFVWITSPTVVYRFYERVCLIKEESSFPKLKELINIIHSGLNKSWICKSGESIISVCFQNNSNTTTKKILLEEYSINYDVFKNDDLGKFAIELSEIIYKDDEYLKKELSNKLVLVDDDTFRYFVTNTTEVVANIAIDDTGTTTETSLRYTEYLPAETIMYSTVTIEHERKKEGRSAHELKETFIENISDVIQIGGDKSIGKGITKVKSVKKSKSNSS